MQLCEPSIPKNQLFEIVKNSARADGHKLACDNTAFVTLELGAYEPVEKTTLLNGGIPKAYFHGDDSTLTRDGLKKLIGFLKHSYNEGLNNKLIGALSGALNSNLQVIKSEDFPYSSVPFYIKASRKNAADLFLNNDFQSLKDNIKLFDIDKYLTTVDSYEQEDLYEEAHERYLSDSYSDAHDIVSVIVNGLKWNDNVGDAVLAITKLQALMREYADYAQGIIHPGYNDLLLDREEDQS